MSGPKLSKGQWALIAIAVFAIAMAGGYALWDTAARRALQVQIDAAHARGEAILPEDFPAPVLPPEAQNAATYWRRAGAVAELSKEENERLSGYEYFAARLPFRSDETDYLRALIGRRPSFLDEVHHMRELPPAEWGVDQTAAVTTVVGSPDLNHQRAVANLLAKIALLAHHDGDDSQVMPSVLDILRAGDDVQRVYQELVPHLVGIGVCALAVGVVEQVVPDLRIGTDEKSARVGDLRRTIDRLLDDSVLDASWQRAAVGSRASMVQTIKSFQAKPVLGTIQTFGLARALNWQAQVMPAALEPNYPAAMARFRKYPPPPRTTFGTVPMLASIFSGSLDRLIETSFRSKCDKRLAATALAIALYRADHAGQNPPSLVALVPNYLSALPVDPLAADGRTFEYLPAATQPCIYSVGMDGVDDGGSIDLTRKRRMDDDEGPFARWERKDAVFYLVRLPRPASRPAE